RVAGYRVGDSVAGGTLQSISEHRVILTRPEGQVDVRLHDPSRPRPQAPPTPGQAEVQPGVQRPAFPIPQPGVPQPFPGAAPQPGPARRPSGGPREAQAPPPAPRGGTPPPTLAPQPPTAPPVPPAQRGRFVVLNFDNADIETVVHAASEIVGFNYVLAPDVRGKVTVQTSGRIPQEDVFGVLLAILEVHGFTAVKSG